MLDEETAVFHTAVRRERIFNQQQIKLLGRSIRSA